MGIPEAQYDALLASLRPHFDEGSGGTGWPPAGCCGETQANKFNKKVDDLATKASELRVPARLVLAQNGASFPGGSDSVVKYGPVVVAWHDSHGNQLMIMQTGRHGVRKFLSFTSL